MAVARCLVEVKALPARVLAIGVALGSSAFSSSNALSSAGGSRWMSADAGSPLLGFIRISRGPSVFVENPRVGLSSCMEETPRSARRRLAGGSPLSVCVFVREAKLVLTS